MLSGRERERDGFKNKQREITVMRAFEFNKEGNYCNERI